MQAWAEQAYLNPRGSIGSGKVNPAMVAGGVTGAAKGIATGGAAGLAVGQPTVGAVIGGLAGGLKGAVDSGRLANPAVALEALGKSQARQLDNLPSRLLNTINEAPQTTQAMYALPLTEQLRQQATPIPVVNPQTMAPLQIPTNQYVPAQPKKPEDEDWTE